MLGACSLALVTFQHHLHATLWIGVFLYGLDITFLLRLENDVKFTIYNLAYLTDLALVLRTIGIIELHMLQRHVYSLIYFLLYSLALLNQIKLFYEYLFKTSMAIVMLGLNAGASFVPFIITYLWSNSSMKANSLLFIVIVSMLIPFPLLEITKVVRYEKTL